MLSCGILEVLAAGGFVYSGELSRAATQNGPHFSDASEREIPLCRLGGFSCRDLDLDLDSWVSQVR